MDINTIQKLDRNSVIGQLNLLPVAELKIVNFYLRNGLVEIYRQNDKEKEDKVFRFKAVKTCMPQEYNYMDRVMNCNQRVDMEEARTMATKKIGQRFELCKECPLKQCIKQTVAEITFETMKLEDADHIRYDIVGYINNIIQKKEKTYEKKADKSLFTGVGTYTLLFVKMILENNLVELENYNEETKVAKFKYVNLTKRENVKFYIEKLFHYYNGDSCNELEINVDEFKFIPDEYLGDYQYFYELAAYYTYKQEIENIDIMKGLQEYLQEKNKEVIVNRSKYFIGVYNRKVKELPCNEKTKDKIREIFNYVLNYYSDSSTPYIPINIAMYTEDKELVERIAQIIGTFMWFFLYLNKDMRTYTQSMNDLLLNKNLIRDLYLVQKDDKLYNKFGMLTIENFENIMFANQMDKNMILNMLIDKIETNNSRVCTVIYGNKETIKSILAPYPKLNTSLFNVELDIDELSIEEVHKMIVDKLELKEPVSEEIKEKLFNYIKQTYGSSELKNTEYVKVLYNKIILKELDTFKMAETQKLDIEDIPNAYNTRDLPEILADLNSLVGLDKIKEQINNLISLLKFNKNANIDISKFNLHMVFTGNPGTGKTTVARLLSDILFNLGYVRKNKLVEVSAKDLIGEYIGQTSGKTYNVLKSAFGGVLFIDEAYSIISTDSKATFASDCISTILKVMEDQRDNIIVIFAGYKNEMENFIKFNPGLQSRIGYKIEFDDYSNEELMQIFKNLLETNKFSITKEAEEKVKSIIEKSSRIENFGNGRYINKMYQDILILHANNMGDEKDKEKLMLITEQDIDEDKLIAKEKSSRKIGF